MANDIKKIIALGEVYILENESMPNIVKIGYTELCSEDRANELSKATGVPLPFTVEESFLVENPKRLEKLIHLHLKKYRLNNKREFFKIDKLSAFIEIGNFIYKTKNIKEIRLKQITSILNFSSRYPQYFGNRSQKEILEHILDVLINNTSKVEVTATLKELNL